MSLSHPLSRTALAGCVICLAVLPPSRADERDRLTVGVQPDGRIVVPTNQVLRPAGTQIAFPGRPVDLALADDGKTLVVKNMKSLVFIDLAGGRIRQTLVSPDGFSVVGLLVRGDRVYVTDALNHLRVAARQKDGTYKWLDPVQLMRPEVGKEVHPAGIAAAEGGRVWVTSTRGNAVQLVDPSAGKVELVVPVGVAPYTIVCPRPDRCYVSNWGGDHPGKGDLSANSSGTPVRIDPRTHVANHGSVSVLGRIENTWKQLKTVPVGLHPSGLATSRGGKLLYVANANSDTISVLDTETDTVVETISCRPEGRLPFGSGTNALALSPDGGTLYAANGTNNCVAVIRLGSKVVERTGKDAPADSRVEGLIPTGWYPGALLLTPDGKKLVVANVKGHGALSPRKADQKGKNSHDHLGTVSLIDVPGREQLAKYTQEVNANNRLAYSLAGLDRPRPNARPVPVPERHGEPSVFEHVIYVIKENRTYDQVFGDMKEGNGDPSLILFGEEVTPNHHALARQFTLLDNFYCSGVLSADGHSWVNEAYVTDYLEKSFGKFTRSYPYEGSDALAFAPTGFLWDNALAHKKTFRNYGEFTKTALPKGTTWTQFYQDHLGGKRAIPITVEPNFANLKPYTHPGYPGFVMAIPDVYRAQVFLEDLKEYERKGTFPNLVYLFLPCDHTSGTSPKQPRPKSMVADNDLALGRIVEAVSKSQFWPKTCILVVEDDPQNGFDHVDGHRTIAQAISPYTRRKFVDHANYNQTGMVKTIELILGLPPMNQMDLSATPMRGCFQDTPDLTPYACLPNRVPLDDLNPTLGQLKGQALYWAKKSLEQDFEEVDEADEDTLNRILWHSVRGYDTPYPQARR